MNCTQSKWSSSNTSRWKGGYLQQVMCMFEYRNQTVFKKGQSNLLYCAPFGWVTVIKLCQCCLVPSQVAAVCGLLLPRLFTPIPQNVFEQKEWNPHSSKNFELLSLLLFAQAGERVIFYSTLFFLVLELLYYYTLYSAPFSQMRKCTITL